MAVINVTSGSQAVLVLGNTSPLATPGAANSLVVPFMQDITVNATPGTVRYSTLDSTASSAFTTVNENSISLNVLLDEDVFFGASNAANKVANDGLLTTSINKEEVFFSVAFEGTDSSDYYVSGKGFIGGLAPTASIDGAVWLSPMEIIVNGELTKATV
tara:strand:+ start:577 stop:1053 length:477 start_codon:yes stop_codon:yes gene_type:complete